ncbi:MAG: class I SAM-dependent methyltransferase, partial [Candidatus Binatia bacterium]
ERSTMESAAAIPMPPLEFREMVGPTDPEFFDNPTGGPVYSGLPPAAYDAVFDFGCGCGRFARMLLQQRLHRPTRYVGIDVHRRMIDWCTERLSSRAPHFRFLHHDVWSPGYGKDNSFKLAEPFPVEDRSFSLVIANSVFTHIYKEQAEYYLFEIARIIRPDGLAMTTWFLFDNESFPFWRGGLPCLFISEVDPTSAVIYDRAWLIETIRRCGLAVRRTYPPPVAGQQWLLQLERRTPNSRDEFPLGEEEAEWLCGATRRAIARPQISPEDIEKRRVGTANSLAGDAHIDRPPPPSLNGLAAAHAELAAIKGSPTWRLARRFSAPMETIRRWIPGRNS